MPPKLPFEADRIDRTRYSAARWSIVIGAILILGLVIVAGLQWRQGGSPLIGHSGDPSSARIDQSQGLTGSGASSSAARPGSTPVPATTGPQIPSATPARATAQPPPQPTPTATPRSTPRRTPTPTPTATPTPTSPPVAGAWPKIGHIYEIVLENHEFGSIIGNSSAPYLNSLADRFGLATNYTAVSHPSLPNYLALWSGSTQGVKDDGHYDFTKGRTLADQIEAAGRQWHVAAENVPLGCFTDDTASGGADGSGDYARKHEPAISWTSVSENASRCQKITDFSHFNAGVGNFWFIAPNLCHDMHDCSVAVGDTWLKGFLPRILTSAAFKADGVVFLTFDEGSSDIGRGGKVATIVISPKARTAFTSSHAHTHYSLVRTIEGLWSMPCIANSCSANTLREFFP